MGDIEEGYAVEYYQASCVFADLSWLELKNGSLNKWKTRRGGNVKLAGSVSLLEVICQRTES